MASPLHAATQRRRAAAPELLVEGVTRTAADQSIPPAHLSATRRNWAATATSAGSLPAGRSV